MKCNNLVIITENIWMLIGDKFWLLIDIAGLSNPETIYVQ